MATQVLIVDDQEPFRLAARAVVEMTDGFEVAGEAETGEAAVEAARDLGPDLVLMVSTYEADEYAPRAAEAGAAAYIPKSEFDPDRLEEAWAAAAR